MSSVEREHRSFANSNQDTEACIGYNKENKRGGALCNQW